MGSTRGRSTRQLCYLVVNSHDSHASGAGSHMSHEEPCIALLRVRRMVLGNDLGVQFTGLRQAGTISHWREPRKHTSKGTGAHEQALVLHP